MDPKASAAERLLRALGVAVKTSALYPGPHPVTTRAVATLQEALRVYTEVYGPFTVRVSKYALSVDGTPFKGSSHVNLAFHLYVRQLAYFKIMPTVSEQALGRFIAGASMDRTSLEEAGGIKQLLLQSGVGNIQVAEMMLEHEETVDTFDLSAVFELFGRGRLAPQERERVLDLLRGGPEAARMLIENAAAMTRGMSEGISEEDQAQQVYQMVRSLDRLLLDEPFEDQPQLYANLAGAQLLVAEPLRTRLARALVTLDGGKFAARLLGDHLSAEQLAQVMQGLVSRQDLAGQVAAFLHALTTDQHKAKAVLAILDARLRSKEQQNPAWLSDAVWSQLRPATVHRDPESLPPFKAEGVAIPADEAAAARAFRESLSVDEADTTREVIKTLVDVLRHEQGDKELIDASDALIGHLPWLVDHQEFALLTRVLESVKEISSEGGTRGKVAGGALKKLTEGRLLDTLLAALWASRDTLAEREVRAALKAVADELVEPLVRVLGSEPRGGMRAMISDLLIEMGADRVAELGRFVTDERWYLVRNTANILGRLRNPQATAYLGRLVNHPDYRVRRETVNALASVGTGEAQAMVAAFLDDPDARIRLRALESLDTGEAWKALPKLLALLERRDPWNRSFELKRATLEALARLGARQSLPVIRKLARARLVFGQRGRELRRLSAVTTDIIEGLAVLDGTTR